MVASETRGIVLICGNPLRRRSGEAVDPAFAAEASAAARAGFTIALLDFESFTQDGDPARAIRRVPRGEPEQPAIYRGWMVRPDHYRQLYEVLAAHGVRLINDPAAYRHCHYLPEWYPALKEHTARSVWLPLSDVERDEPPISRVMETLRVFGNASVIVKDYVKSRKHEWAEACFIPSASDAQAVERVVRRFLELQGRDLNEGLVFREYIALESLGVNAKTGMPLSAEWRVFFLDGEPMWEGAYWEGVVYRSAFPPRELFPPLAARVQSRFFTMDIAQRRDGGWTVIELGDGQVSGLPPPRTPNLHIDALALYEDLARRWPHG
jgi:hypothetical protein